MTTNSAVTIKAQVTIFYRAVIIYDFDIRIAFSTQRAFQNPLLKINGKPAPKQGRFRGKPFFAHLGQHATSSPDRQPFQERPVYGMLRLAPTFIPAYSGRMNFFSGGMCRSLLFAGLAALAVTGCKPTQQEPKNATEPTEQILYSFDQSPFISPRIIQDLSCLISDNGDQVVAINLLKSQDSNRYFGDYEVVTNAGQNPCVQIDSTTIENGETNHSSFWYQYVGQTSSGIHILETANSAGGSGIFKSLLLVELQWDTGISCDWKNLVVKTGEKRLLIKKVGEIPLGDRWNGELKVIGNSVCVGKDHGWFTRTDGTGGGYNTNDIVLEINLR